jgi:putative transposase
VSFSVEVPDPDSAPHGRDGGGRVVGVDVGITDLAVLSTGERVPNPRHLDAALSTLRRHGATTCTSSPPASSPATTRS